MQVQAHQHVLPSMSPASDTFDALVCLEELVDLSICMCTPVRYCAESLIFYIRWALVIASHMQTVPFRVSVCCACFVLYRL